MTSSTDLVHLYHWTAPTTSHLGAILEAGVIWTVESNVRLDVPDAGPRVVWMTDNGSVPNDGQPHWSNSGGELKRGARLTVELPAEGVHHYPDWARSHGVDETTWAALEAGGGNCQEWYVTERPIHRHSIVELLILEPAPERHFADDDLRKLFQSAGRRRALGLPKMRKVATYEVGGVVEAIWEKAR